MTTSRARTKRSKSEVGQLRGPLNGLIADRMRQLGMETVKEFADKFGIGRSTIYDLVRGRSDGSISNPSLETISRLADALERPAHEILYLVSPSTRGAATTVRASQVPVYLAGCAGAGPEQLQEIHDHTVLVEAEFAYGRDLSAFHVCGESMAGGRHPIYDGDVVIVDRNLGGEINQPVVARLAGNGYVVKRLRPGGILDSTNPEYNDEEQAVIMPDRVAQIVGRVVRVQSTLIR